MDTEIRLADLFPSRWLKPKDLVDAGVSQIVARVTRVTLEEVQPQPGEKVQRLVLHLHHNKPYLVTTKADARQLTDAYHVTTANQLVGREVVIKLDVWRRQAVLRIAPPPAAPKPKPPATNSTRPAPIPPPVATAPSPATGEGEEPPPPVAAVAADRDDPQPWPPHAPWVARKRTGEVDWTTSFWGAAAALGVSRDAALRLLSANGGAFENATAELWMQKS